MRDSRGDRIIIRADPVRTTTFTPELPAVRTSVCYVTVRSVYTVVTKALECTIEHGYYPDIVYFPSQVDSDEWSIFPFPIPVELYAETLIYRADFLIPRFRLTVNKDLSVLIRSGLPMTLNNSATHSQVLRPACYTFSNHLRQAMLRDPITIKTRHAVFRCRIINMTRQLLTNGIAICRPGIIQVPTRMFAIRF